MGQLRALCVQKGVLPPIALEKEDFISALLRYLERQAGKSAPKKENTDPKAELPPELCEPAMSVAERKEKWNKMVGQHLVGVRFGAADLEVMPLKTLKSFCTQHRCLPKIAMERADFVNALTPLIGVPAPGAIDTDKIEKEAAAKAAAKGGAKAKPTGPPARKDFSKFLGSHKPNFTTADLLDMPESTLKTLCMMHGALPPGPPDELKKPQLLQALSRLAVLPNAGAI